jgi:hypothetical protein
LQDKLASLSRKQNILLQRYSSMHDRQPADNMALEATEKLQDDFDSQIGDLEAE